MRREVHWLRSAIEDLADQAEFISRENPQAGRRISAELRAFGDRLAEFAVGRPSRMPGFFEAVVPRLPYILCFRIIKRGNLETVEILRVIHTARDWRSAAGRNDHADAKVTSPALSSARSKVTSPA